jgi:hypothetical protein
MPSLAAALVLLVGSTGHAATLALTDVQVVTLGATQRAAPRSSA